jgi:hypothetical protein
LQGTLIHKTLPNKNRIIIHYTVMNATSQRVTVLLRTMNVIAILIHIGTQLRTGVRNATNILNYNTLLTV